MYVLIKGGGGLIGIFSSMKKMKIVIEHYIKDHYENNGHYGNFHFQWVKMNMDEPWFTKDGKEPPKESNAILSLWTMHSEKFTHKVKTDWVNGKVISMDSNDTSNLHEED